MADSKQLIDKTGSLLSLTITLTLVWEAQGQHIGLSHLTPSVPKLPLTTTTYQHRCNKYVNLHPLSTTSDACALRQRADVFLSVGMAPTFSSSMPAYMAALGLLVWITYQYLIELGSHRSRQRDAGENLAPLTCRKLPSQCNKILQAGTRQLLRAAMIAYIIAFSATGSNAEPLHPTAGGISIWALDQNLTDVPALCQKTLGFRDPSTIERPSAEAASHLKDRAAQLQKLHSKAGPEQWPAFTGAQPLTVENLCDLLTTPVQHFNTTGVAVATSRSIPPDQGAYPLQFKVIGEPAILATQQQHTAGPTTYRDQPSVMHSQTIVAMRHTCWDPGGRPDALPSLMPARYLYSPTLSILAQRWAHAPYMICAALQALTLKSSDVAGISTQTPGYTTEALARASIVSDIDSILLSKCDIHAATECRAARYHKTKGKQGEVWNFTLAATPQAIPLILGLLPLRGFWDTPWQIPQGEPGEVTPGELTPGVPLMRFARSPIEDSKQEYHRVCSLPWSPESSMLLEQQSPVHKSQLPIAKRPLQHSVEHDLYAQQELTTMAGDVCQANLMYTAISSTDGHAQVPVQFTVDIYYNAALKAEVTAMADRGAQCNALLSAYLVQLVRDARPNPETVLVSPGARLVEYYDIYATRCSLQSDMFSNAWFIIQSSLLCSNVHYHVPCPSCTEDNPTCKRRLCYRVIINYRHNEANTPTLHRTQLIFTFTDPLVKELLLALGGIGLEVAGRFKMSMAVRPAREVRLQYGLAFHLPTVTAAWRPKAMQSVLLRLGEETADLCTGMKVAPLTLYLQCYDGAHLIPGLHCTFLVPTPLHYESKPNDMYHLGMACAICHPAPRMPYALLRWQDARVCAVQNQCPWDVLHQACIIYAGTFLPITAEALTSAGDGAYRQALYLAGGTPISFLQEQDLLRMQPVTGMTFILGLARAVDQAVALLACARAGGLPITGGAVRLALGTSRHSSAGISRHFTHLDADWGNVLPWAIGSLRGTPPVRELAALPIAEKVATCMEIMTAIKKAVPPTTGPADEPEPPAKQDMLALMVLAAAERLSPAKVNDLSRKTYPSPNTYFNKCSLTSHAAQVRPDLRQSSEHACHTVLLQTTLLWCPHNILVQIYCIPPHTRLCVLIQCAITHSQEPARAQDAQAQPSPPFSDRPQTKKRTKVDGSMAERHAEIAANPRLLQVLHYHILLRANMPITHKETFLQHILQLNDINAVSTHMIVINISHPNDDFALHRRALTRRTHPLETLAAPPEQSPLSRKTLRTPQRTLQWTWRMQPSDLSHTHSQVKV